MATVVCIKKLTANLACCLIIFEHCCLKKSFNQSNLLTHWTSSSPTFKKYKYKATVANY